MNRLLKADEEEFGCLVVQYLDGTLSSAELETFNTLLDTNPGYQSLFVDTCLQSRIYAEALRGRVQLGMADKAPVVVRATNRQWASRILSWGGVAAAIVALAYWAIVALTLGRSLHSNPSAVATNSPISDSGHPRPNQAGSVAVVRDATDVQWSKNTFSKPTESSILSGEPLKIESGTMELELKAGTKLVVEGPADWSIDGDNHVTLRGGKIFAKVPARAIGFTVTTPTSTVVDLGTEFGVEVDNSQNTQVVVFKGEVSVGRPAQAVAQNQEIRLSAGQAVRLTISGEVTRRTDSESKAIATTFARSISRSATPDAEDSSQQRLDRNAQRTRARLLSLYPFDGATGNVVVGAPDGTFEGAAGANNLPQYVSGKVGAQAVNFDGVDDRVNATVYGYPKASPQKGPSNGLWTGSATFWIKTTASKAGYVLGAQEGNTTLNLIANPDNIPGQLILSIRTSALNVFATTLAEPDNLWRNGDWHQVVITWNITTGAAGTGVGAIWIDGVSKPTKITINGATATDGFNAWEGNPMLIGARSKHGAAGGFFTGSLDDVGIWNNQLTEPEVKALYNLGSDAILNYNARDVQILLDVFAHVPGAKGRTSDGRTWKYAAGLSGNLAEATDNRTTIVLDAVNHTGVQMISNPQK